jgi:hypothetical protein
LILREKLRKKPDIFEGCRLFKNNPNLQGKIISEIATHRRLTILQEKDYYIQLFLAAVCYCPKKYQNNNLLYLSQAFFRASKFPKEQSPENGRRRKIDIHSIESSLDYWCSLNDESSLALNFF